MVTGWWAGLISSSEMCSRQVCGKVWVTGIVGGTDLLPVGFCVWHMWAKQGLALLMMISFPCTKVAYPSTYAAAYHAYAYNYNRHLTHTVRVKYIDIASILGTTTRVDYMSTVCALYR